MRARPSLPAAPLLVLLAALLTGSGFAAKGPAAQDTEVAQAGPETGPVTGPVLLPDGPLAEALANLRARAVAPAPIAALGEPWPRWDDRSASGWGGEHAWRTWVELLRAEAEGPSAPARRARLALLARVQERVGDAWGHLAQCGPSPVLLTVLPALVPGVPLEHLGSSAPLPDGVLLRPAVPPPADVGRVVFGAFVGQEMQHTALRVGAATLSLRVLVEGDGVQLDVEQSAGPPVSLRLVPPLPPEVEVRSLYLDWEEAGTERRAVELAFDAETPAHTLWARFRESGTRSVAPLPSAGLPELVAGSSITVVVPTARLGEPFLARFTEALGELFQLPARLRDAQGAAEDARSATRSPIELHLDGDVDVERKLRGLLSVIEGAALSRER